MTKKITCAYCNTIGYIEERRCTGCGASLLVAEELKKAEKPSEAPSFPTKISEVGAAYEEYDSCHTKETIPQRKLRNAMKAFGINNSDDVLFIYDATVFGSNKQGFALCKSGVYWKNDWATPTKRNFLTWETYKERKIKKKKKDSIISFGRGDDIFILNEDELSSLTEFLKKVQALLA